MGAVRRGEEARRRRRGADRIIRALFQTFAHAMGLYGYHLPNMDDIAEISHEYYNNDLRGGEGHMEVGKLIMNVVDSKAHMTLSVKPFGCMPSAGVSDGVQSAITEKFPGHDLLRGRDERRRAGELLLARADVPLQGQAGGDRRVRARARGARGDARAGEGVPRGEPALRELAPQGAAPATPGTAPTSSPRSRRSSRRRAPSACASGS